MDEKPQSGMSLSESISEITKGITSSIELPKFDVRKMYETSAHSRAMAEIAEMNEAKSASGYRTRLVELANGFDAALDAEHEVGVRLVSFGQTVTFHLEDIGYYNPSLIIFHGRNEHDEQVQLVQHISQISILFIKMKRLDMSKPKSKIGFASEPTE